MDERGKVVTGRAFWPTSAAQLTCGYTYALQLATAGAISVNSWAGLCVFSLQSNRMCIRFQRNRACTCVNTSQLPLNPFILSTELGGKQK